MLSTADITTINSQSKRKNKLDENSFSSCAKSSHSKKILTENGTFCALLQIFGEFNNKKNIFPVREINF